MVRRSPAAVGNDLGPSLARPLLLLVEVRVDALLLSIVDDIALEQLVDLLPLAVLAESDDCPGLLRLGDRPPQPGEVVLLVKPRVDLRQRRDIALVSRTEHDLVLEDRNRHVPEVELARHVLE